MSSITLPSAEPTALRVTFFDTENKHGDVREVSALSEFAASLGDLAQEIEPDRPKKELRLLTFAEFRGDHVVGACFERARVLGADVDQGESISANDMHALVKESGVNAVYYESPSSTPNARRWRLFVECDRWITALNGYKAAHRRMIAAMPQRLRTAIATGSCDATRGWYIPRPGAIIEHVEGDPLDLDGLQFEPDARRAQLEQLGDHKPVNPKSAPGKRRVKRAKEILAEADPAVQGGDEPGHTTLFRLAERLVRTLRLPVTLAQDLAWELFNPRCVPPWGEDERRDFDRKFTEAVTRGEFDWGSSELFERNMTRIARATAKRETTRALEFRARGVR
jgi:hypothetical protein